MYQIVTQSRPMTLPKTFTKSQLCEILTDINGTPCSLYRLKYIFLTEQFIQQELNLSWNEYGRIREFTPAQTERIILHLKLKPDDL